MAASPGRPGSALVILRLWRMHPFLFFPADQGHADDLRAGIGSSGGVHLTEAGQTAARRAVMASAIRSRQAGSQPQMRSWGAPGSMARRLISALRTIMLFSPRRFDCNDHLMTEALHNRHQVQTRARSASAVGLHPAFAAYFRMQMPKYGFLRSRNCSRQRTISSAAAPFLPSEPKQHLLSCRRSSPRPAVSATACCAAAFPAAGCRPPHIPDAPPVTRGKAQRPRTCFHPARFP